MNDIHPRPSRHCGARAHEARRRVAKKPRPSLQLYTLRTSIDENGLENTLARVADLGFELVELHRIEAYRDAYESLLPTMGLRPISAHATLVDGDADAAIRLAARLGAGTLIEPRIDAARWRAPGDIEESAAALNSVAERARDEGIVIGYHNHDHEIRRDFDGRTGLELFAEALDDDIVLEVDVYWAEVGGVRAAELCSRLGPRVKYLHVKDGCRSGKISEQQPLGHGEIGIADALAAAPQAVRVVELDDYAGDMYDAVERSLRYLEEVDR